MLILFANNSFSKKVFGRISCTVNYVILLNMAKYTLETLSGMKGKVRLIALDLDGTLLNSQKEISQRTRSALIKAASCGIGIAITTGRHPRSVLRYAEQIGDGKPSGYAVIFNGAAVISVDDYAQDPVDCGFPVLCDETCTGREASVIASFALDHGCGVHGYSKERGLLVQSVNRHSYREISHNQVAYQEIDFKKCDSSEHFFKFLCTGEPDILDRFREDLEDRSVRDLAATFSVMRSDPDFLEFIPGRSTKGTALKALCGKIGISPSEVMAFGDAENDLDMIRIAGIGVAMQNSQLEQLLEEADLVTLSNDDDGVAAAVEKIL